MTEQNARVLVVDGDVVLLKQIRQLLVTTLYCEVDTTPNPEYAFELFLKQNYDLLIFDLNLPKLDGALLYSLIRKVCALLPAAERKLPPLLAMNGDSASQKRVAEWLREPGVRGLIPKPMDFSLLTELVNELLLEKITRISITGTRRLI